MAEVSEDRFLQIYGNIIVQSWALPAFKERLESETAEVLKEYGLDPGNATITLLQPNQPNALGVTDKTAESQYQMWILGKQRGNIPFYVADEPPEGAGGEALSDEELMALAGGGWSVSCCSCTPCCCC
jgi:hypothetical protein